MNHKNKQLEDAFDKFLSSSNLKEIISAFNQLCDIADLNPAENSSSFYKLLRNKYQGYWKANSLFSKLDKKVTQKEYRNQTACSRLNTLIIGAGPCGLRCAIEFALLGARVVVLEKRNSFARNNVLHLWPFVIHDLNFLGAKKFYGLFCSGSINHISIRRLQCILLKIALLFGVQVFIGVTFKELVPPVVQDSDRDIVTGEGDISNILQTKKRFGWRGKISPDDCILSNYEFDVLVGADGKSNILEFKRKELRCRLAIAITANFINNNTPEEAQVEEISGVAFIFNQQFFKDLYNKTGIDLENIVYYKDETHYYVMTAKKHSLLAKGVLNKDYDDPETLLNPDNINQVALQNYAKEAANVATNYQLTNLQFSLNHRGDPDVALFDFTHMFAAENASMVIERKEYPLIKMLVGDSLLEPFWPTGSGCGLGFLSSLDGAWLVRRMGMINNALAADKISRSTHNSLMLEAIAERESVYQRLSQTTASNMPKNLDTYTIDPRTRYTQCKLRCIEIQQILHLYDTDDHMKILSLTTKSTNKQSYNNASPSPKIIGLNNSFNSSLKDISISQEDSAEGSIMKSEQILRWFQIRLDRYCDSKRFKIDDLNKSWSSGVPFLCLIHLYRPDLVDLASVNSENKHYNLEKVFSIFEREFKIRSSLSADDDWENQDPVKMVYYLEKIYSTLQSLNPIRSGENVEPRVRETRQLKRRSIPNTTVGNTVLDKFPSINHPGKPTRRSIGNRLKINDIEQGIIRQRQEEIIQQYEPKEHVSVKKIHSKSLVTAISEKLSTNKLFNKPHKDVKAKFLDRNGTRLLKHPENQGFCSQACHFCKKKIIHTESGRFQDICFHKQCLRCQQCDKILVAGQIKFLDYSEKGREAFYCSIHYQQMRLSRTKVNSIQIKGTQGNIVLKDEVDRGLKIKKPKYSLKDFGELIGNAKTYTLPVNRLFDSMTDISNDQLQKKLNTVLCNLRRINDDSDEEYNGSVDESYDEGLLLDTMESLYEDQLCWPCGYSRGDLDYAIKRCSVIRRNRLLYKKYKSKDDSTTDESDLDYDYSDHCRTSDEEFLDEVAVFGKPQEVDESKSYVAASNREVVVPASVDVMDLIDDSNHCAVPIDSEVASVLTNVESTEPGTNTKEMDYDNVALVDSGNIAISDHSAQKEASKSMRQLAKLKFCTEPPKPVTINSKEFIGQMNRKKMEIVKVPCCFGEAEIITSVESHIIKIDNKTMMSSVTGQRAAVVLLTASVITTAEYGDNVCCDEEVGNPSGRGPIELPIIGSTKATLATDEFDDNSAGIISSGSRHMFTRRRQHSLTNNLFNEICDIKDIDSLSINTEDSSMTQTDLISENDIRKKNNYVPLLKIQKCHQRATLDSELDIVSLGISSLAEPALMVKSSSNESINSLDNCSSAKSSSPSSSSVSYASDRLASNEDDNKNNNIVNNRHSSATTATTTNNRTSKSKRLKQRFALKTNRVTTKKKKNSIQEEPHLLQCCPVIDETSPMDLMSKELEGRIYESVSPPHDILLDGSVQMHCYELMSSPPCQLVMDGVPLTVSSLDNSSSKQRVCDIHRQLEDIEDRLRQLERKSVDIGDSCLSSSTPPPPAPPSS